ncbi:MAG: hypothetical protein LBE82_13330 [Chitinophagaceae bacterium]|jgi:hypothetical protein|nr:hypothetical protein [Chitinophagaceae bacterium]
MKWFISTVLIAGLSYLLGMQNALPWYSFVFGAFIIAVIISLKKGAAFFSGFIGVGVLWFVLCFKIDSANQHILSTKVANILPLSGSHTMLIILTAFIGGLLGGMSALTGSLLRNRK